MILVCPLCQAKYLVTAQYFAAGPRQVKCARCAHSWRAEMPKDDSIIAPPPSPIDIPQATPAPIETSQPAAAHGLHLPHIHMPHLHLPHVHMTAQLKIAVAILTGVVALTLIMWLLFDRQDIAQKWPILEPIYEKVGLNIYQHGEGLSFEQVRSEMYFEGGIMKLGVEGKIQNGTRKVQLIPAIVATAIGSGGDVMQSWQIDAPASKVFPGERIKFRSAINAPQGTVAEVKLHFVEKKDASE
jgi:predicted Zn finger-like uncharacterized protein